MAGFVSQSPLPGVEAAAAAVARDWETIWQSELAALAADREWQEGVQAAAAWWSALAAASHEPPAGRAGADAPAGAAAADAAPGAGDAELDRLRRRVAELERAAGGA